MFGWFGTVFGIIGAVLVAANDFREIGYIFFLIGSFFSLIAAIKEKHNANIALWLVFASINVFGLIKSL
jgi:hypothetical protein